MTKCLKPYFCKLEKQQCIRRSATCWAQRVDTQVDWPNSFWDMTKCLKPYFCKLDKQQCIRPSATCWAQGVDIQVDWPNSFCPDMTKIRFKTLFLSNLDKQQCIGPSATCRAQGVVHQQVATGPIHCCFSRYDKNKVLNLIFVKSGETTVYSAQSLPADAQRVDTQVDWTNSFWDMTKCLKPYFCKLDKQQCIRPSATCWAQGVDIQVDWPNSLSPICKNKVLNILSYLRNYWAIDLSVNALCSAGSAAPNTLLFLNLQK